MLRTIVCSMVLAFGIPAAVAQEPPARLLYVTSDVDSDRIIVSNIQFSRTDDFTLAGREKIEDQRVSNAVAVFQTNRRLIAYSVFVASWETVLLQADESVQDFQAEDYSAYVLTNQRVLNFNGRNGVWAQTDR